VFRKMFCSCDNDLLSIIVYLKALSKIVNVLHHFDWLINKIANIDLVLGLKG